MGWAGSTTRKNGAQDGQGALTKGSENTNSSNAGAVLGPDGVGAYGGVGTSRSQTHAKGVKTGQTVGADGKLVTNVSQVPGSDPAKYQITVSVSLTGKLGVSGGVEKENDMSQLENKNAAKGSVGVSASGAAALAGTFVHVYDEAETQKYLASVESGADAGPKELQIIKQLVRGDLSGAKALMNNVQASMMSPDGAAAMKEGDSAEVSIDLSGSASGNLGGDTGGFGGKISGGVSGGLKLKRTVARKGGKVVVTVAIDHTKGTEAGASASMELATMGGSTKSTEVSTEAATFTLDPDNHAYAEQFGKVGAAHSVESLRQVVTDNKGIVTSSSTSDGKSENNTVTAGVGASVLRSATPTAWTTPSRPTRTARAPKTGPAPRAAVSVSADRPG